MRFVHTIGKKEEGRRKVVGGGKWLGIVWKGREGCVGEC